MTRREAIVNSRGSRGNRDTWNSCGVAVWIHGSSYVGSVRMRQFDSAYRRGVNTKHRQEHRSSADCSNHRFRYERLEKRRRTVDRLGRGHAQRPNHDFGYLQHPSLGDQRVYGHGHGDLGRRYDEIGHLADQGQPSAQHCDNVSCGCNCGNRLQRHPE